MFLAISGTNLFILYMSVIFVIVFISVRRFIKKNNKSKQLQAEKMSDLNTFILQYEASKKVAADKPAEAESSNAYENKLDTETIVRINALYHDAEMSVEQISSKTGVSIEQIEKVIG